MPSLTLLAALSLLNTLALSTSLPPNLSRLQPRQNSTTQTPPDTSVCYLTAQASPDDEDKGSDATASIYAQIDIADKTTDERGQPGQGLLDNLQGQCGKLIPDPAHPNRADSWGKNPVTGELSWYRLNVLLPLGATASCVEMAISNAEEQVVKCSENW